MDGMLDLFESVSESESRNQYFVGFLKTCDDHQAFSSKPQHVIQPVIGYINRRLNTPASRSEGLLLLKTFLPQCSDEVFIDNALSWMLQSLKGGEGQKKHSASEISYETLKMLLQMSGELPEMTKHVANTVVPKLIEQLPCIPLQANLAALQCLEVLFRNYGGPCGPSKNTLERYLMQFVDDKDVCVVHAAGRCIALLPLLGGGGTLGTNHRKSWNLLQQRLCITLNLVLDELYEDIIEMNTTFVTMNSSVQKLSIPPIAAPSPVLRIHQLTTRFGNLTRFLQAMLCGEFPVPKGVLPDIILSVVCRGLAVNCNTLGWKASSEKLTVGSLLPQIHAALLSVLKSLISCCGKNLLQYGPLICKLVLQTLKWTRPDGWSNAVQKPYERLRVIACSALETWLCMSKTASCVELFTDELVMMILPDIRTPRSSVTLAVVTPKAKHLTKQQRRQLAQQRDSQVYSDSRASGTGDEGVRTRLVDRLSNQKMCTAALKTLQWVVLAAGNLIKPIIHKSLQETVVLLLVELQRTASPRDFPLPYSSAACRVELYRLLHILTLQPHPTMPPPTQFALYLLSSGQNDVSVEVTGFCTVALSSVEKLVHPPHTTLQFPVSLEEMQDVIKSGSTMVHSQQDLNSDDTTMEDDIHTEENGHENIELEKEIELTRPVVNQKDSHLFCSETSTVSRTKEKDCEIKKRKLQHIESSERVKQLAQSQKSNAKQTKELIEIDIIYSSNDDEIEEVMKDSCHQSLVDKNIDPTLCSHKEVAQKDIANGTQQPEKLPTISEGTSDKDSVESISSTPIVDLMDSDIDEPLKLVSSDEESGSIEIQELPNYERDNGDHQGPSSEGNASKKGFSDSVKDNIGATQTLEVLKLTDSSDKQSKMKVVLEGDQEGGGDDNYDPEQQSTKRRRMDEKQNEENRGQGMLVNVLEKNKSVSDSSDKEEDMLACFVDVISINDS